MARNDVFSPVLHPFCVVVVAREWCYDRPAMHVSKVMSNECVARFGFKPSFLCSLRKTHVPVFFLRFFVGWVFLVGVFNLFVGCLLVLNRLVRPSSLCIILVVKYFTHSCGIYKAGCELF